MPRQQLKLGTLNLYNLQLPGQPMYYGKTYTEKEYAAKIDWTAAKVRQMDADIIAFQELWDPQCLQDVFSAAGLGQDYTLVSNKRQPAGISVAMAVRAPNRKTRHEWIQKFPAELVLKKRKGTKDEPNYEMSVNIKEFSRQVLRVEIDVPIRNSRPKQIVVFAIHLKSKLGIDLDEQEKNQKKISAHSAAIGTTLATIRRVAEAAALRVILNKATYHTNTPVVVMGDLNDSQHSMTTAIISGKPKYRLFASSRVGRSSDRGLYSVATMQEYRSLRDVYYTYIHDGQRESLDHIFVNEQFYDYSSNRIWSFHDMKNFNDHLEDSDTATSDHGAVVATFDYNPASRRKKKTRKKARKKTKTV